MATRYPAEFRQRAVELARLREKPIKQLAADLGIPDQTLHNWLKQADIDPHQADEGLTTEERAELVRLRRAHPGAGMGDGKPQRGTAHVAPRDTHPTMR